MTAITHRTLDTPLGDLTAVLHDGVLAGLYFPGHWTKPKAEIFGAPAADGFDAVAAQLDEYLAGDRETFDLEIVAAGDPFQQTVWERLRAIPYGATVTYGEIARELGGTGLARRVGGAVGSNPISIVVPCHRVVGSNGSLTGYAGGLERKQALLALEGATLL